MMGQITEDFVQRAMRCCQLGQRPSLTVWETRQLLTAWVEWQACREDAERYRWLRGQGWIDDSIMREVRQAWEHHRDEQKKHELHALRTR